MLGSDAVDAARQALPHYGIGATDLRELSLLSLSENGTFLVRYDDPTQATAQPAELVLRVHRPGYQSAASIRGELTWMGALRADAGISTPRLVPAADGSAAVDLGPEASVRHVSAFALIDGVTGEEAPERFSMRELGRITALLHRHASGWTPPPDFERFGWDLEACLGPAARWGSHVGAPGVAAADEPLLAEAADVVRERVEGYGRDRARYGLIHADLRLSNLMITPEDTLVVIDFDDCGWGWFVYDLAAAISWLEDDPSTPAAISDWLAGYAGVRTLDPTDLAMIPVFVMMRRLMLTAWLGSHPDSPPALALGERYGAGTVEIARRFLSDPTWLAVPSEATART